MFEYCQFFRMNISSAEIRGLHICLKIGLKRHKVRLVCGGCFRGFLCLLCTRAGGFRSVLRRREWYDIAACGFRLWFVRSGRVLRLFRLWFWFSGLLHILHPFQLLGRRGKYRRVLGRGNGHFAGGGDFLDFFPDFLRQACVIKGYGAVGVDMGNRLIIAVYFFQTVPDRQAVAQVSIAQVIPGGRVFRFRVHGSFGYIRLRVCSSFGYIRLGGCGCFRCGWLCLRLFHFRRGWCGGVRQKPPEQE